MDNFEKINSAKWAMDQSPVSSLNSEGGNKKKGSLRNPLPPPQQEGILIDGLLDQDDNDDDDDDDDDDGQTEDTDNLPSPQLPQSWMDPPENPKYAESGWDTVKGKSSRSNRNATTSSTRQVLRSQSRPGNFINQSHNDRSSTKTLPSHINPNVRTSEGTVNTYIPIFPSKSRVINHASSSSAQISAPISSERNIQPRKGAEGFHTSDNSNRRPPLKQPVDSSSSRRYIKGPLPKGPSKPNLSPPGSKFISQGGKRRAAHPTGSGFNKFPDNPALTSWRRYEKPNARIPIPRYINPESFKKRSPATVQRRVQSIIPRVDEIGQATNTHIALQRAGQDRMELWVYGDVTGVEAAVAMIKEWFSEPQLNYSNAKKNEQNFAKIRGFDEAKWVAAEKKLMREEQRQQFRREMPDEDFPAIKFFKWDIDEIGCRPEEALGRNYEVLDQIRMTCSTYIQPKSLRDPVFKLAGQNGEGVTKALQMLENVVQKIRNQDSDLDATWIMVGIHRFPPNSQVHMLDFTSPRSLDPGRTLVDKIPRLSRKALSKLPAWSSAVNLDLEEVALLQENITEALKKIKLCPGTVSMKVRLGYFVLSGYRPVDDSGGYPLPIFKSMVADPRVEGYVSRAFSWDDTPILKRVQEGTNLLCTGDIFHPDLRSVKPIYMARCIFQSDDPRNTEICLEVKFQDSDDTYELSSLQWSRIFKNSEDSTTLLNAAIVDLKNSLSWQFDMDTIDVIHKNKIEPALQNFASLIKLNQKRAQTSELSSGDHFIQFPFHHPVVPRLKSWTNSRVWRFNLIDCEYTCELSLVQGSYRHHTSWNSITPQWTVSIQHKQWETLLSSNEIVRMGKDSRWRDPIELFFPTDGFGHSTSSELASELSTLKLDPKGTSEKYPQSDSITTFGTDTTITTSDLETTPTVSQGMSLFLDKLSGIQRLVVSHSSAHKHSTSSFIDAPEDDPDYDDSDSSFSSD